MAAKPDAVVIGAGPNGLAAALTLAEAGRRVRVYEAADEPGGGCRTAALTLPGFRHDVCSTVQALAKVSPFFTRLELPVQFREPEIALAHPLDDGQAALVHRDLARTAEGLGRDARAWRHLFASSGPELFDDVLGDLRHRPAHPLRFVRFGLPGLLPVTALARAAFRDDATRALFAGLGAHSMRRLDVHLTSAVAMALAASAHATGWPVVEGGSARLIDALVARLIELDVEFVCGTRIDRLSAVPSTPLTLLDVTPRQLDMIASSQLPARYRRALHRFRYGPGVFKVDYALHEPVPWTNQACHQAGTIHLGGTMDEIAAGEAAVEAGRHSERPFVLAVQATTADPTRAPAGRHTLWAYCHVPSGSSLDRTAAIEAQLERFAPGFRDTVLARATRTASGYESYDPNYVGGDINGGRYGLRQALFGPVARWSRYRTPIAGVYLCSSSTAPGGGVHGMCGVHAARAALRDVA